MRSKHIFSLGVVIAFFASGCGDDPTAPDRSFDKPSLTNISGDAYNEVWCETFNAGGVYVKCTIILPSETSQQSWPCYDSCVDDIMGTWTEGGNFATEPPGFPPEFYTNLNIEERRLVHKRPFQALRVYQAAQDAINWAQGREPNTMHNGKGDALRHALWSCLMARSIGEFPAFEWGYAHEYGATPADEVGMDLYNNAAGRDAAEVSGSCETNVLNAWDNGLLVVLQ